MRLQWEVLNQLRGLYWANAHLFRVSPYPYAPLWVNWVYRVMEWVDYKVISPVSSRLMYWRGDLLDRYCKCPKCKERDRRAEEFRKALEGGK